MKQLSFAERLELELAKAEKAAVVRRPYGCAAKPQYDWSQVTARGYKADQHRSYTV